MQLDRYSDEVTTKQNVVDNMTDIFVAKTPDKKNFKLKDGTLLVMDLYDESGDKIAGNAEIEIAGQKPTQRNPREIDEKPYRPYNQISVDRQYDKNNQDQLKLDIDSGHIDFIEGHMLKIRLKADSKVDWTNPNTILEFEVEEQPYRAPRN